MKQLKYLMILCAFFTVSCEGFLEEEPRSSLTSGQFFQSEPDFNAALTATYGVLQGLEGNLIRFSSLNSDEATPGIFGINSGDNFAFDENDYTGSNPAFDGWWTRLYRGINQANGIIAASGEVRLSDDQQELVDRYVAEAKFLRGLYYFYLVISFGDVPLIVEPTTVLDGLEVERTPASQVYTQIENDFMDAEMALPESYGGGDVGRATSGAAASMLAKAYLFQEKFTDARDKAAQVMASGTYSLLDDFLAVNSNTDKNSDEHIFSIQFARDFVENDANRVYGAVTQSGVSADIPAGVGGQSQYAAEEQFALDFPPGYRKDVTILDRILPDGMGGTIDVEFYHCRKYFDTTGDQGDRGDNNYNIIRYADVMLIFAEAENEANSGPSAAAYDAVNQIRRRAMNQDINTPDAAVDLPAGLSQDAFRDAVLDERKWELAFEGHRRWDLLRTGRYLDVVPGSATHLLYPVPEAEREINPKLSQNSGYGN